MRLAIADLIISHYWGYKLSKQGSDSKAYLIKGKCAPEDSIQNPFDILRKVEFLR